MKSDKRNQLGSTARALANWKATGRTRGVEHLQAIIRFLAFNPLPPADGWADRLVQCRTGSGLSQKESAARIGVDQGTLERGEPESTGAFEGRTQGFVAEVEAASHKVTLPCQYSLAADSSNWLVLRAALLLSHFRFCTMKTVEQ